ncbi:MAG TPA: hypothetical protein EYQ83_08585 [Acidobacteria bacterium]|nr:hypothetical protein [Acidobacteriota bacterium]
MTAKTDQVPSWRIQMISALALCALATTATAQTQHGDDSQPTAVDTAVAGAPTASGEVDNTPGPRASDGTNGSPAGAEIAEQQPDLAEVLRRLDLLAEEVERLRSGEDVAPVSVEDARRLGLAPSAAAAYGLDRGVSIAGYGEMLLENFADESEAGTPTGRATQFDFLRAIIYAGYRFNDRFLFNSEIEIQRLKKWETGWQGH